MKLKVYLAAPFFTEEQLSHVKKLEYLIEEAGWELFSPRLGPAAVQMNEIIRDRKQWFDNPVGDAPPPPSSDLRKSVFVDNWSNIDDADLVLAVIDNFDVGVMWEVGYAFAVNVAIVTHTARNYGCNLMLAESILGHTKSLDGVKDVLYHIQKGYANHERGEAYAYVMKFYKNAFALKEGPDERRQEEA